MMSLLRRIVRRAGVERGFTLVEVMVAMVLGMVICGALFAILEIAMHQTSQITDRVQATQLGRDAMAAVTGEMNSACLARGFAPVQAESKPGELRFITATGHSPEIKASEASAHAIVWSGKAGYNEKTKKYENLSGTLVDNTYAVTGTWPEFTSTFKGTPKATRVLAEYVYATLKTGSSTEYNPIFQYEKYATAATTGTAEAAKALEPLPYKEGTEKGLTSTEAKSAASVVIRFQTAPSNNVTKLDRVAEFGSQVTFAFAAPSAESSISDQPCE